jgi:hypothetical protein
MIAAFLNAAYSHKVLGMLQFAQSGERQFLAVGTAR